jgi:methyl-accepting chemotaxis protein
MKRRRFSLVGLFFPESHREGLDIGLVRRVPFIVGICFIVFFFFLFASTTRYLAHPDTYRLFLISIVTVNFSFPIVLALVRGKKYRAAGILCSLALITQTASVAILIPVESYTDLYRVSIYIIAANVVNGLIIIVETQFYLMTVATFLVFFGSLALNFIPKFGFRNSDLNSIIFTLFFLLIATTATLYLTIRLNRSLLNLAKTELERNKSKAEDLGRLILDSKGSLEIGARLKHESLLSLEASDVVKEHIGSLEAESSHLSLNASSLEKSNEAIVGYAKAMLETVISQNSVLDETSAAITEMSATINNIGNIANQKKDEVNRLLSRLAAQERDISRLRGYFDRIKDSSAKVLSVAGAILDISEKTNMLAMNASIEAAHAGASGKGFAVISGEIRKLSDETKNSTQNISEALSENNEVIQETDQIIASFTGAMSETSQKVQATLNAMEEIINGLSEMTVAAGEINVATRNMVSIAHDTEESVKGVTSRVESGADDVSEVSTFAAQLKAEVDDLASRFSLIEGTLRGIAEIGEQNIGHIATLSKGLDSILKE